MQKIEHFVTTPSCSVTNHVNNLTHVNANGANTNACSCPTGKTLKSTWFRTATPSGPVTPSATMATSNPNNVAYRRLYHCKGT